MARRANGPITMALSVWPQPTAAVTTLSDWHTSSFGGSNSEPRQMLAKCGPKARENAKRIGCRSASLSSSAR